MARYSNNGTILVLLHSLVFPSHDLKFGAHVVFMLCNVVYDRGNAKNADLLHELTRRSPSEFQWTATCQEELEELKQCLTIPPILAYPRFDSEFTVIIDASKVAMHGYCF